MEPRCPLFDIDRRQLLRAGGLSLGVASVGIGATAGARRGGAREIEIEEGTNIAVALSPDGRQIAFDLYGLLWLMPATGGNARCITDAFADLAYPCWSPDGKRIAVQSYRTGNFHIWTIEADGSGAKQWTHGASDHREPCFAPDGRSILLSSDATGRYAIHKLDLQSGRLTQISRGNSQDSEPAISSDGRTIAYVADAGRLMTLRGDSGVEEVASVPKAPNWTRSSQLYAPAFAPDGQLSYLRIVDGQPELVVAGRVLVSGEDIYPFRPNWTSDGSLIYASQGRIRRRGADGKTAFIPFKARIAAAAPAEIRKERDFSSGALRTVKGIASPTLSPDGRHVAFGALNDIYVLTVGNPVPRKITSGPSCKCHPAWSPDGSSLVLSDDRAGKLDLWLYDLASGNKRQLTNVAGAAIFSCWSPDGRSIAFLNQAGALHLADVESGKVRQLYDALWLPGRPSFSPDGSKVALAAFKPVTARFREGLSEILIIDLASGKGTYTPIAANRSIGTRGDDGPIWSPDGRFLAYVFASNLWVQPVDRDGRFSGAARKLTRAVTDAPSWSGNSAELLYLSNAELRIVSARDSSSRTVPLRLQWALARAPERSVIRGGRIWEGLGPHYREGDVVLRGNRIDDVAPPGGGGSGDARIIDATGMTILPGLIDVHTHRHVQGNGYGDRMGRALLAMGITTTRSPGAAAYHMTEDREAVDAGLRVGPRHYSTGEALDGSRIYYNFMRPVTEPGQLALELQRAEALNYDMIKTYVRMDNRTQAEVIAAAHAMGLPVSSHYHYPALRNGSDGVEHLGATSRFGFSRTITALGAAYGDVHKLFGATAAGRTPTLFAANALLPECPDLVEDPRVRTLLPAWEYERLTAMARMIASGDRRPLLASLARNVDQIKQMMALGSHVQTGTDAPIDTVGVSYHLNLRAMTRFGISPYEALLTGTRHAARLLSKDLGSIARGKLADLVAVEGDPLANIADAARVRMVVRDGRGFTVEALLAPFKDVRASIPAADAISLASRETYFWHDQHYLDAGQIACCTDQHARSA